MRVQQLHELNLTLDCVPYEFLTAGNGVWSCSNFTAFDISVKTRFTENYVGKQVNGHFLYIEHLTEELTITTPCNLKIEEQGELIESFFSIYFDSLNEIGYETLDPEPR